jgi:hypothetical protein
VLFALLLALAAPSSAWSDVGPYANVLNPSGAVVKQFGANSGAQPGTQIQLAENYARCKKTSTCPSSSAPPSYPTVALDAGAYQLVTPFGVVGGPRCVGIFAYSAVRLQAASGAVIEDDLTAANPCPTLTTGVDDVLFAGADPTNVNVIGSSVNISGMQINVGYGARFGLEVGALNGPGSSISGLTVTKPNSSGILVGAKDLLVIGTSGSPVQVTNNVVQYSHDDGITLGGVWIKAAGNTVTSAADHGIVAFQESSVAGATDEEISGNTITGSVYGVSLDGSVLPGRRHRVYNNTIGNTCMGVIVFRQVEANVAGNYIYSPNEASCPGTPFATSVGIGILDSYNNVAWSNQTWDYRRGIWIRDDGVSADGQGTHWNYIGVVASWGQPFPDAWPVAGNWFNNAYIGMEVGSSSSVTTPNDTFNAFEGNVVSGPSPGGACYFFNNQQWSHGNTPASCDRP